MIILKSAREIENIRRGGGIVRKILMELKDYAKPGISTLELDQLAEKLTGQFQVKPAFRGYKGYQHCLCASINDEVVHGIPSSKRFLKEGDIIGLDFGVIYEGYYSDSAITVGIGKISDEARKLIRVTEEALWQGIAQMRPKNRLFDISHAVQKHVEQNGFSVVRQFVGHGIGQALHEDPAIPNYGDPQTGIELKAGMVFAVEPMVNTRGGDVRVLNDGWTAVTTDGGLSAHFEHTIAISEEGPSVLTGVSPQ